MTDHQRKTWSKWMINRFLSMDSSLIPIVNEVNKYNMPDDVVMSMYISLLPKRASYNKYIKGQLKTFDPEEISIIKRHYECGEDDAEMIRTMYGDVPNGIEQLNELLFQYGFTATITKRKIISDKKVTTKKVVKGKKTK